MHDKESRKKTLDPITLYKEQLMYEGTLTEDIAKAIEQEAYAEAEAAAKFAEQSPFPPTSELQTDIYWEIGNPEHKTSTGTLLFNSIEE